MTGETFNAYESSIRNWIQKERERDIYLAQIREEKSKDLGNIRCVKSEDNRILVREDEMKER